MEVLPFIPIQARKPEGAAQQQNERQSDTQCQTPGLASGRARPAREPGRIPRQPLRTRQTSISPHRTL